MELLNHIIVLFLIFEDPPYSFLVFFLIGGKLLYNVVLVSAEQ